MSSPLSRRNLLRGTLAGGSLLSLGRFSRTASGSPPGGGEGSVPLDPAIEPLVRLLEETPRDRLLESVAERVRGGAGYTDVLAALMLAGVRNVEPRPSVGFKFHTVLAVISYHLLGSQAGGSDRPRESVEELLEENRRA